MFIIFFKNKLIQNAQYQIFLLFISLQLCNYKVIFSQCQPVQIIKINSSSISYPPSLDYNASGYISPIKDQSKCGCCWAFASIALLQSYFLRQGLPTLALSQQYLLQCVGSLPGAIKNNCYGGLIQNGLNYGVSNGVPLSSQYPYLSGSYNGPNEFAFSRGICEEETVFKPTNVSVRKLALTSDEDLKAALHIYGPIAVAMYTPGSMSDYNGGVFYDPTCANPTTENHAMIVYGYDRDGNWLLKNQWGVKWGNKGCMVLNKTTNCGIFKSAVALIPI